MAQQKGIRLGTMRLRVRSLALLSAAGVDQKRQKKKRKEKERNIKINKLSFKMLKRKINLCYF